MGQLTNEQKRLMFINRQPSLTYIGPFDRNEVDI